MSDRPLDDGNNIDRLMHDEGAVRGGIHAVKWTGAHWLCGCGHAFGDSDEQIAAFLAHAPGGTLVVYSSRTNDDVRLAAARMTHAITTRMPKPDGEGFWLHVPVERGPGGKSASYISTPQTMYVVDEKPDWFKVTDNSPPETS